VSDATVAKTKELKKRLWGQKKAKKESTSVSFLETAVFSREGLFLAHLVSRCVRHARHVSC